MRLIASRQHGLTSHNDVTRDLFARHDLDFIKSTVLTRYAYPTSLLPKLPNAREFTM